ncbi:4-(cytidine 5'-diphospho)-2-C-methyl-D-erythritol kinase [Corynebacterium halotolerans]|uniref:4-diphosphocytidyl-2-C-methyl-D-erythritol kinase n=1 Tax=Corynebacterium halotolerans YIM 70093 = DSM 44683 TaxID=1121362 RepID=M1P5I0_9CORY|nr:4-(cytidine 5'-diphospho)-2-C-methyl-D-erythritol kinase [Corynebacterium halotolerans]AGF71911.1 4-diphosphocytidyl-2-C-methyl-D-erythritol kinase [Corynebacterium halotolerans YIM 70093 = DSM 44683]
MTRTIHARAHAKVNLHLGVDELRGDGYHELVTVFQSLSLHDDLTLTVHDDERVAEGSIVRGMTVTGFDAAKVPTDPGNLAWRAVDAVVDTARATHGGLDLPAVDLHLTKGIPTAGGMAGGSADAAAALVAANTLLDEQVPALGRDGLHELAAELGSDVPFTLHGGTMLGTGRGEQLVPLLARGTWHWALVFSAEGLSTPAVFGKLDDLRAEGRDLPPSLNTAPLSRALTSGDPGQLAAVLANDLQAPALSLRPDLRRTLDAGRRAGALAGIVSGSGPTCAFLCDSELAAADLVDDLIAAGVAYTGTVAHGPAAGAHLIS